MISPPSSVTLISQVSSARSGACDSHVAHTLALRPVVTMTGMKAVCVVLLGLCLTVVADPAWQFSVNGNSDPADDTNEGGHLVPDSGFQYRFDTVGAGFTDNNAAQFSANNFADLPEQTFDPASEATNFAVKSDDNSNAEYDYNNNQFATQTDPTATSYVLGEPEERDAQPEYVYDSRSGAGADETSLATLDTQEQEQESYVYDATKPSSDDEGTSFATQTTKVTGAAPGTTEHHGPVAFYTPGSETDGAFRFYDARNPEERKATSVLDVDSETGAESFAVNQDASGDSTVASTSSIFATSVIPRGKHGCPDTYWAKHPAQWPVEIKVSTPVCKAFGGKNLRANLEIIFGTTTVFQALLDTRKDPYSKLLRTGVAALLNSYARPAFTLKPAVVSRQFHSALASKTLAAEQAQKFENENHAFGDSECK